MYSTFFNLIHESPYPDMGALKLAPTIFGSEVVASRKFNTGKIDYHLRKVTAAMKRKTKPRYLKYHYKLQYMVLFACEKSEF